MTVDISKVGSDFKLDVRVWLETHQLETLWISLDIPGITGSEGPVVGKEAHLSLLVPEESINLWYVTLIVFIFYRWPAGYGNQPIYNLKVSIREHATSQRILNDVVKKIAFRTAKLTQEPYADDRQGTSFFFRINGVDVFAKGTNWIPADAFESRVTPAVIRYDVAQESHSIGICWSAVRKPI